MCANTISESGVGRVILDWPFVPSFSAAPKFKNEAQREAIIEIDFERRPGTGSEEFV